MQGYSTFIAERKERLARVKAEAEQRKMGGKKMFDAQKGKKGGRRRKRLAVFSKRKSKPDLSSGGVLPFYQTVKFADLLKVNWEVLGVRPHVSLGVSAPKYLHPTSIIYRDTVDKHAEEFENSIKNFPHLERPYVKDAKKAAERRAYFFYKQCEEREVDTLVYGDSSKYLPRDLIFASSY